MTNKFINLFKKNWVGAVAGASVGIISVLLYKFFGGDFTFAIANLQGRTADASSTFNQFELLSIAYVVIVFAWVIIGAAIGIFIDNKIGFKFSKGAKNVLLISAILLLIYSLSIAPTSREGTASAIAGASKTLVGGGWFNTLSQSSGAFLFFLGWVITSILGAFKPQPQIPIWIFFIAGFIILLMLRRRGGGEQPLIIQR